MRAVASETTPSAEVSRHIPALDGIRALAILLVIPHNVDLLRPPVPLVDYPAALYLHAGWIGVQLFFVLSGFLISGNLLDTRGSGNYFSAFFGRRALRILPLYFGVLFITLAIAPLLVTLPQEMRATQSNQVWLWTFLVNWTQPFGGGVYGFGHFWSLAVEEQFYLLWPLVVFWCRPKALLWVCAAAVSLALVARALLVSAHLPAETLYMFTFCRMDALALGAAVAALIRIPAAIARLQRAAPALAWAAALIFIATSAATRGLAMYDVSTQTIGYSLLSLSFALFILVAALPTAGTLRMAINVLESPPLRLIGRYSYGMYVFHLPLHVLFGTALLHLFASDITATVALLYTVGMTALSFLVAALSYELFERHFLKLKCRLMPAPESPQPALKVR